MSLKFKYGDMFDEPKGYIMHGCNAQGVMGSGVANIIRQRYHEAYKVYALQFPNYIMGEVIPVKVADDLVIINAITQDDYGTHKIQADYDAIRQAMRGAVHVVSSGWDGVPQELHMPFIGAGLAGGDPDTIVASCKKSLLMLLSTLRCGCTTLSTCTYSKMNPTMCCGFGAQRPNENIPNFVRSPNYPSGRAGIHNILAHRKSRSGGPHHRLN